MENSNCRYTAPEYLKTVSLHSKSGSTIPTEKVEFNSFEYRHYIDYMWPRLMLIL